ncbi:MAG TPA: D-alanyl-D-alanine carboxypeptidase family protein, partial [Pyrinomonadaceae bacterium]|nr:D-alanyl-D-alanine carboxypeptidase family protein [Pyrinomonadaceae bacterium]
RRKISTYPQPDQLLTVPAAEFWDSSRADELRQVERQTYAAYKRMLAAAIADPSLQLSTRDGELAASEKYLKIISAFRSREYQDRLRKLEPHAGRAALAVNSPHFTGRALDLYVGGEPTITKDPNRMLQTGTRAYRWLVRNAERFGFCPYFYEPWHWEYCAP